MQRFRRVRINRASPHVTLLVFGLTSGTYAHGAEPPKTGPTEAGGETEIIRAPTEKSFYGWKILLTGELGGMLAAASLALPDSPIGSTPASVSFIVGAPLYAFGGPIVHWTQGYFTKGLLSAGANIAVPLVAGLAAMGTSSESHTRGFARGAAVGMLIVPIIDALVLGWEDVPRELGSARAGPRNAIALSPAVEVRAEGCMVWGVRGGF